MILVKAQLGRPSITADKLPCGVICTIVHSFYCTKEHPNVDIRRSSGEADYLNSDHGEDTDDDEDYDGDDSLWPSFLITLCSLPLHEAA